MKQTTKLVELHLEDRFSKSTDVRTKELSYHQYCRLKNDIANGIASFNQVRSGVNFNWTIKKMINL